MKDVSLKNKSILMFVLAAIWVTANIGVIFLGIYTFTDTENRLWLVRKLHTNLYHIELHLQNMDADKQKHLSAIRQLSDEVQKSIKILKLGGYYQEQQKVLPCPKELLHYVIEIDADLEKQYSLWEKMMQYGFTSDTTAASKFVESVSLAKTKIDNTLQTFDLLTEVVEKDYQKRRYQHDQFIVILLIINLVSILIAGIVFYQNIIRPLRKVAYRVASYVEYPTQERFIEGQVSDDEIGQLAKAFNTLTEWLWLSIQNLEKIRQGSGELLSNESFAKHPLEARLKETLVAFSSLRQSEFEHNWQMEGTTSLTDVLDNHGGNLSEFCRAVLQFLVKYTSATCGVFFILENVEKVEHATFLGVDSDSYNLTEKGIILRAIQEKKPIVVNGYENNLKISTGTSLFTPISLVVVPLFSASHTTLQGILEIAYDAPLPPYKVQFFANVSDNIASSIAEVKYTRKMGEMLQQTQDLMHDLQMSEEELRQNMEELLASQEEIRRQMQRAETLKNELAARISVLDETAIMSESDLYGNITYVNKKLLEITGYTEEEVLGKPHKILRHPDTPSEVFREMWATIKSGKLFRAIIKNRKKDGSPYWVNAVVTPIFDADGKIAKYISIRFDITEQIQQNEKIQALLNETSYQNKLLLQKEEELTKSYAELKRSKELLDEYNASLERKVQERTAEVIAQKESIESSIRYAKRIQYAMLPLIDEIQKHLPESFVLYKPKDVVSGDFYWFAQENGKIFIAAADCTGHGVPGGFMSMIGMSKLNQIVKENHIFQANKILDKLHEEIFAALNRQTNTQVKDGMDISLCVIDKQRRSIEFSGAHQSLLYFDENNVLQLIKGDRNGIGGNYHLTDNHFTLYQIPYPTLPTEFYIFSDGITDQFGGPENRKYGMKNLSKLLQEIHTEEMNLQHYHISTVLTHWQGENKQTDDMLMIGFRLP
ncbi:MAG: PAS domain S-box protein [Cytophagales bacterium]|nr:PAS domain S-box protein [Cytophagales bacterium]MDW8384905.1 PAS domain S-box protein [Flammeovirgaceae bacterium]